VDVQHISEEEITVSVKMGHVSDSEDTGDDSFKGVLPTVNRVLEKNNKEMQWLEWGTERYLNLFHHALNN
jgi:hypothetical protein